MIKIGNEKTHFGSDLVDSRADSGLLSRVGTASLREGQGRRRLGAGGYSYFECYSCQTIDHASSKGRSFNGEGGREMYEGVSL